MAIKTYSRRILVFSIRLWMLCSCRFMFASERFGMYKIAFKIIFAAITRVENFSPILTFSIVPNCQQQYPPFWPEGRHSKKYGPVFTIDHISHNHYSNIKTWLFRINKKVRILARIFSLLIVNDFNANYSDNEFRKLEHEN